MIVLKVNRADFLNNKAKDRRKLMLGFTAEEYIDAFPHNPEYVGYMTKLGKGAYTFCIDEVIRDNPKLPHPVGTIRVLNYQDVKERELILRAITYDYGLKDNEYEIII